MQQGYLKAAAASRNLSGAIGPTLMDFCVERENGVDFGRSLLNASAKSGKRWAMLRRIRESPRARLAKNAPCTMPYAPFMRRSAI
jgi:hypothetical protein